MSVLNVISSRLGLGGSRGFVGKRSALAVLSNGRGEATQANDDKEAQSAADEPQKNPQGLSLAMQEYMKRKHTHDQFIVQQRSDFELGKKHLANMMGVSAEEMTQADVDKAIEYLFPSGLTEPKARPLLRPPEEIFPRQKEAEFDAQGRPFHPFFYTAKPHYTQLLYDVVQQLELCLQLGARMRSQKTMQQDPDLVLDERNLASSRWKTQAEISEMILEPIKEPDYKEILIAVTRLLEMPFSYKFKEFIWKFRVEEDSLANRMELPELQTDANGNAFIEAIGQRKSGLAKVRVTKPGTGKFTLTNIDFPDHPQDITYFYGLNQRQQIMFPLQFTNLLGHVDVDCIVSATGGSTGQAGAIRYALSLCLRSFVDADKLDEMAVVGLITQNIAVRERKKPGLMGARRSRHWRKR